MPPASAKHTVQLGKAAQARGFLQLLPLSRAAEIRQMFSRQIGCAELLDSCDSPLPRKTEVEAQGRGGEGLGS